MTSNHRTRYMSQRELEEDEWRTDNTRPRRTCPVHRNQTMIRAGVAHICPLDHSDDQGNGYGR